MTLDLVTGRLIVILRHFIWGPRTVTIFIIKKNNSFITYENDYELILIIKGNVK